MAFTMGKEGLVTLVKDAQTLEDAFHKLKGRIVVVESLSEFIMVEPRREFAIVKKFSGEPYHYLHPYGSSIGYNVMEPLID